jgi:hypothetical protein
VPPRPPAYRLVSWPVRVVILTLALGSVWLMLATWATGIRLSKIMTEIGKNNAAAEAAAARGTAGGGGEPGIVYIQSPAATAHH